MCIDGVILKIVAMECFFMFVLEYMFGLTLKSQQKVVMDMPLRACNAMHAMLG